MRGLAFAAIGALLLAAPAAGDVYSHKHSVDTRISVLQGRVAGAQQRAERLVSVMETSTAAWRRSKTTLRYIAASSTG